MMSGCRDIISYNFQQAAKIKLTQNSRKQKLLLIIGYSYIMVSLIIFCHTIEIVVALELYCVLVPCIKCLVITYLGSGSES